MAKYKQKRMPSLFGDNIFTEDPEEWYLLWLQGDFHILQELETFKIVVNN